MATLQQQIAQTFLARLLETEALDANRTEELRLLLGGTKRIKVDELVKVFTQPAGGDVK
jgi:hypothetical protein